MLASNKKMKKMTKEMAKEIMMKAVDAKASLYSERKSSDIATVYDRAYQECGIKEKDFLTEEVLESYWFRRLGRITSPICILAVQRFLEVEKSVPENFCPCSYCPYADKREEARGKYACRPDCVPTRRFSHLNETSLEELDTYIRCVEAPDDVMARGAKELIEEIFDKEIISESSEWHRSHLITG